MVGHKGEFRLLARRGRVKHWGAFYITDMIDKHGHHTSVSKRAHKRTPKQAIADPHPGFTTPRTDKGEYGKFPKTLPLDKKGKRLVEHR